MKLSGVIMQIFLVTVIVNGEEQLFPSVIAFNLIFFICMILGIVLTIAVVLMRSEVISDFSINVDSLKVDDKNPITKTVPVTTNYLFRMVGRSGPSSYSFLTYY
jgi:hypothetical protein